MALSDERRFRLYETFRELYDDEVADDMMDAYPPAGLGEPVRAGELNLLRVEMKGAIAELRTEMADLRTELRTEMADLRTEMHVLYRRQTLALAGMMTAGWAGIAALVGLG